MATIDIKLKSYDELIFEITKLNTDKYLLEQENKQLEEKIGKIKELVKNYEELEQVLGAGKPRFPLYKMQKILGDKE